MALNLVTQTKVTAADTSAASQRGAQVAAAEPLPLPAPEEVAKLFPNLEILECLGRGGMGAVYKARQPKLDRFVALKILLRHRADGPTETAFAERFAREARALARLNHPNIVAVHDYGEAGGHPFLLMEFVDGLTLRQLMQRGKLTAEEALAIVPKICDALQFAHQQGIVHRDIKPENILLDKQGQVKIADFGIARILAPGLQDQSLTGGKVVGTPHYMAPEQLEQPSKVDHRADIYSLGVVFYEMLTGELPLGRFQPPSSCARGVHVDVRLDEVVLHALEKEPDRRYQHANEVKSDVETIVTTTQAGRRTPPPSAHPESALQSASPGSAQLERTRWLAVLAGLILCIMGSFIGVSMPWQLGIPTILWGVLGFVCATIKAIRSGATPAQDLAAVQSARSIILLDAAGLCFIGVLAATHFSALPRPFAVLAAAACAIGLIASILRLLASRSLVSILDRRGSSPAVEAVCVRIRQHPWGARIGLTLGILTALVFVGAGLVAWFPGENEPNVTVHGAVTDAATGQPIVGARVADDGYGGGVGKAPQEAWTDAAGRYSLRTWYEEHNLSASAPRYQSRFHTLLTKPFGYAPEVKLDFQLQPAKITTAQESPRQVAASWLRRVKAGNRDAWDLTTGSPGLGTGPSFTGLAQFDQIRPAHQVGNDERVLVTSDAFQDNAGQTRVFYAMLRLQEGRWLIDAHSTVSPSEVARVTQGFTMHGGMRWDVLPGELEGRWLGPCMDFILEAGGTGAWFVNSPAGPLPDPEPFRWTVSGSTLVWRYATGSEESEITWVEEGYFRFQARKPGGKDGSVSRQRPAAR